MKHLSFRIKGIPVAKGRPRFFRVGKYVGTYTPKKTKEWENLIAESVLKYKPKKLWAGPIHMFVIFYMPRPKSIKKHIYEHIKKPDLDNLIKCVSDALQGIIYEKDSQIYYITARKIYTQEKKEPGISIILCEEVQNDKRNRQFKGALGD